MSLCSGAKKVFELVIVFFLSSLFCFILVSIFSAVSVSACPFFLCLIKHSFDLLLPFLFAVLCFEFLRVSFAESHNSLLVVVLMSSRCPTRQLIRVCLACFMAWFHLVWNAESSFFIISSLM